MSTIAFLTITNGLIPTATTTTAMWGVVNASIISQPCQLQPLLLLLMLLLLLPLVPQATQTFLNCYDHLNQLTLHRTLSICHVWLIERLVWPSFFPLFSPHLVVSPFQTENHDTVAAITTTVNIKKNKHLLHRLTRYTVQVITKPCVTHCSVPTFFLLPPFCSNPSHHTLVDSNLCPLYCPWLCFLQMVETFD